MNASLCNLEFVTEFPAIPVANTTEGGGCEMAGSEIEGFDTTDNSAAQPAAASSTRRVSAILSAASPPSSSCMLQSADCPRRPSLSTEGNPSWINDRKCKINVWERFYVWLHEHQRNLPNFTLWWHFGISFSGYIEAEFMRNTLFRKQCNLHCFYIVGNFYTPLKFP